MVNRRTLPVAAAALAAALLAAETVGVPGSSTVYPTQDDVEVGKPGKLRLTGVAMRTKFLFNVYTVGSYVAQGAAVHDAAELAAADCPKRLHLVMERDVPGKDMAEAFRAAVRMNHPEPELTAEVNALVQHLQAVALKKGDHVLLTHLPGVGLQCSLVGQRELVIKNVALSRAVWEIYLGRHNLGESIKKGLVARL